MVLMYNSQSFKELVEYFAIFYYLGNGIRYMTKIQNCFIGSSSGVFYRAPLSTAIELVVSA